MLLNLPSKKKPNLKLALLLITTISVFSIPTSPAYSQVDNNDTPDNLDLSPENILELMKSPQALLEQFSIDFSRDISTVDLLSFSLGIVAYGIFIWHFYRLISRREIVSLPLTKYNSDGKKITSLAVYIIKYIIVFPLVITAWFFVYSLFMFFLAPDIPQDFVFLVVISLVVAIRIAAYYKEDLSKDLAKMIPFALLGIFLVNTSIFTIDQFSDRLSGFIPFIGKIAAFVIFAIGVEAVLRILFLIKRKIMPAPEVKVEEEIERTIDAKMRYKMEQMEKKQEDLQHQLEEKIEKTKDNLKDKIVKNEEKIEKTKDNLEDKVKDNAEKNQKLNEEIENKIKDTVNGSKKDETEKDGSPTSKENPRDKK